MSNNSFDPSDFPPWLSTLESLTTLYAILSQLFQLSSFTISLRFQHLICSWFSFVRQNDGEYTTSRTNSCIFVQPGTVTDSVSTEYQTTFSLDISILWWELMPKILHGSQFRYSLKWLFPFIFVILISKLLIFFSFFLFYGVIGCWRTISWMAL